MEIDVADYNWSLPLKAKHRIPQSPLSADPDVPRGREGWLCDIADGYLWVDFGAPYSVVACDPSEVA
jgi:hypothetical protein